MRGRQAKTMAREPSRKTVVMRKVGRKKASKNAFSRAAIFSSWLLVAVSVLKCFSTLDLAIMTKEVDMERSSRWPPLNQMKNMKTNWWADSKVPSAEETMTDHFCTCSVWTKTAAVLTRRFREATNVAG